MGRLRTVHFGLPPRMRKIKNTFYFDHGSSRGHRKYTSLGQDKAAALQKYAQLMHPERYARKHHCLYRHFDVNGRLLYVGISVSALLRLIDHRLNADWFKQIATVTVEHFDNRQSALSAERDAIAREHPLHNVAKPKTDDFVSKPFNSEQTAGAGDLLEDGVSH